MDKNTMDKYNRAEFQDEFNECYKTIADLTTKNKALREGIEDVLNKWDKNIDIINKVNLKALLSKDRTK